MVRLMTAERARRAALAAERYRAIGYPLEAAFWDKKARDYARQDKKVRQ
jgi:hypothetical protein